MRERKLVFLESQWHVSLCAGCFTYTNSCDPHNNLLRPVRILFFWCGTRKRLSNLPKITAKWLQCADKLSLNPALFFLQRRCSFQPSTLSTITLLSSSECWTKDLKINMYNQQLTISLSPSHQLYTIFLCSFTKMWAIDIPTVSWN